jgi:hypothetical protein
LPAQGPGPSPEVVPAHIRALPGADAAGPHDQTAALRPAGNRGSLSTGALIAIGVFIGLVMALAVVGLISTAR